MKRKFLFLSCTILSYASLYSMHNKSQELQAQFKKNKNNLTKLEKLQRHITNLKPVVELSQSGTQTDTQIYQDKLYNRIQYLKAKQKFNALEHKAADVPTKLTELEKVQTQLKDVTTSGCGLDPQELIRINKILLPYTTLIIDTGRLFQSTKPNDVKDFLPLTEDDIHKKFKPFNCLQKNKQGNTLLQHALNIRLPICALKYLLTCGQSVNDSNNNKENAIHTAILTNNVAGLKTILSHKSEPYPQLEPPISIIADTFVNISKSLNLQDACIQLCSDTENSTAIDAQDSLGQTPLHKACTKKLVNCTKLLMTHKASADITDAQGKKAIDRLFELPWTHESTLICKATLDVYQPHTICSIHQDILEKIQKTNKRNLTQVTPTIIEKLESYSTKQRVKKKNISVKTTFPTKIFQALHENTLSKTILEIIKHEASSLDTPNNQNETPLCWAMHNNPTCCHTLLSHKADPNKPSQYIFNSIMFMLTPFEHVATLSDSKLLKKMMLLLLQYNANPNVGKIFPPLHRMAYDNDPVGIMLLLKSNADINLVDIWGRTALHVACKESAGKSIVTLLDHGANPNIVNSSNSMAALDYCYQQGKTNFILLLLSCGATTFKNKVFVDNKEIDIAKSTVSQALQKCIRLCGPYIEVMLSEKGIHLQIPKE